MKFPSRLAAVSLALAAVAAHAQVAKIGSRPSAPPSGNVVSAQSAPKPTGLRPTFPAGIATGSGAAVSGDPIASNAATTTPEGVAATTPNNAVVTGSAGVATTTTDVENNLFTSTASNTAVMGASGGPLARGPAQTVASGGLGYSAIDVARAFHGADGNGDRELSRSEFTRLGLRTLSFEEMDRNFDGVISRFEYEDGLR